jgi:hypothetical protein
MGKLAISQELSDKISNSLRIKQSDIDSGGNKPIIRKVEPPKKDSPQRQRQPSPKHSPIKKRYEYYEYPKQPAPKHSPIKKRYEYYEYPKQPAPRYSPISHPNKANDLNYLKISKIVFISSIVGGIGITLGIKIGTILFL